MKAKTLKSLLTLSILMAGASLCCLAGTIYGTLATKSIIQREIIERGFAEFDDTGKWKWKEKQ